MKNVRYSIITLMIAALLLMAACGKDNTFRPYETPWGSTIRVSDPIAATSIGLPVHGVLSAFVLGQDGNPLDQMDVGMVVSVNENASSYGSLNYGPLTIGSLINMDAVAYWDDFGFPHYISDNHGKVTVELFSPPGYSGSLDVTFFTHTAQDSTSLTITASGGICFNGSDDDLDGAVDAWDTGCSDYDDPAE